MMCYALDLPAKRLAFLTNKEVLKVLEKLIFRYFRALTEWFTTLPAAY